MNDASIQAVSDAVETATEIADDAVRHPWVRRLSQLGFYAKGLLFLVIGCLAIAAVLGNRGVQLEDPRGALAIIASQKFGSVLLIVFIVGATGHGVWNILRGITDVDGLGSKWFAIVVRVFQVLIGFFYMGLAICAVDLVLASRVVEGPSNAEETVVSLVLAVPLFGAGIIGIIGLGLVGTGLVECYNGLSGRFQATYRKWQISGFHGTLITLLGILSFTARAVLLIVLGYIFLRAAFYNQVGEAIGLDAALRTLLQTSYGKVLVLTAGLGLIGHGILAFYEAKYRRIC